MLHFEIEGCAISPVCRRSMMQMRKPKTSPSEACYTTERALLWMLDDRCVEGFGLAMEHTKSVSRGSDGRRHCVGYLGVVVCSSQPWNCYNLPPPSRSQLRALAKALLTFSKVVRRSRHEATSKVQISLRHAHGKATAYLVVGQRGLEMGPLQCEDQSLGLSVKSVCQLLGLR